MANWKNENRVPRNIFLKYKFRILPCYSSKHEHTKVSINHYTSISPPGYKVLRYGYYSKAPTNQGCALIEGMLYYLVRA